MSAAPISRQLPVPPPAYWPTDCMSEWTMLAEVHKAVEVNVNHENGDEVAFHLVTLNALLGTSATCISALYFRKENAKLKVLEAIAETGTKITAALQRDLVNAKCAGYGAAYDFADRLHSSLVHSIDALRSVLSWLKLERSQQ